jgi:hypothetical protein
MTISATFQVLTDTCDNGSHVHVLNISFLPEKEKGKS